MSDVAPEPFRQYAVLEVQPFTFELTKNQFAEALALQISYMVSEWTEVFIKEWEKRNNE